MEQENTMKETLLGEIQSDEILENETGVLQ